MNYKCVEYALTTTIDPAHDIHIAVRGTWKEATLELKDANDSSVSIPFLRIRAQPPLDTPSLPVRIHGLGEVQVLATQFRYALSEPLLAIIKIAYGAHPVTFVVRNEAHTKMIPAVLVFADHRPSVIHE